MQFPNSGTGRPYIRLDARTATFKASCVDSDAVEVDLVGKIVDLDLANAEQGWLKVDQHGADFVPLAKRDDWNGTPSPSPEYSPAVSLELRSEAWDDPPVRELRGGSRAITSGARARARAKPSGSRSRCHKLCEMAGERRV